MLNSWYLSNDMQFFVISPLIVYPLWKLDKVGGKKGKITMAVMSLAWIVIATAVPLYLTIQNDEELHGRSGASGFYTKPWNRFQPYLIGLFLGHVLHKMRHQPRLNISGRVAGCLWVVAAATAASVVGGIAWYNMVSPLVPSLWERAAYNGFSKLGWSLALGWVILACEKVRQIFTHLQIN